MPWLGVLEAFLHNTVVLIVYLLEMMGAAVIVFGAARDFIWYFTGRAINIRLDLACSLALGLEFKLGGEILRTVIVRDLQEMLHVGAIILLRGALSFLIHREIGQLAEGHHTENIQSDIMLHATDLHET